MCSTTAARIALISGAIEELAGRGAVIGRAPAVGTTAAGDDVADRPAAVWAMAAQRAPALAKRLAGHPAARAGLRAEGEGGEPARSVPGVAESPDLADGPRSLDQLDLLLRAARPVHREPARHQVVAAVAAGHLDHVAGGAEAGDLLGQDELHRRTAHRCATFLGSYRAVLV